jgi:hypothetical protein
MKCAIRPVLLMFALSPAAVLAQKSGSDLPGAISPAYEASDPMGGGGGGGGGQAAPSAFSGGPFSRLTFGATVSSLGVGVQAGTSLTPRIDLRAFGNYLNLTHRWTDQGFDLNMNMELPNAGAKVDIYPMRKFPLRVSAGYLFVNQNRVRVDYRAEQGTTFTVNNINWTSDNADPVHGSGILSIGGTGPMITAGLGRIVSRSRRHFTFPFEAGAVFIHTPVITFDMFGQICAPDQTMCQAAATYPTFATNLAQQVAKWNQKAAPYHVFPIVEGGVAYSFSWRRRRVE